MGTTTTTTHNLLLLKEHNNNRHYSFFKKLIPYSFYALIPLAFIHFCFSPVSFSQIQHFPSTNRINNIPSSPSQQGSLRENIAPCDYSNGEWVPNKSAPLYNGTNCSTIKPGQNCGAFGRPDKDYLHWKWKPDKCNLSRFRPKLFLKLLKNKHISFVGDSMARNQLESLLCMISPVSKPQLYYTNGEDNKFRKWNFPSYNINISIYWSPFLVKGVEKNADQDFNTLYLDLVDEKWASDLDRTDVLVLSVGHWFLHPAKFYYQDSVLGCHYTPNCTEVGFYDVYGKALKTTFQNIVQRRKGTITLTAMLTTFSPAHFEGEWDKFGACSKTQPFKGNEVILDGMNAEMRRIGVEEVEKAKLGVEGFGNSNVRLEALDITKLALLRPDGHPGPYMHPFPFANGVAERVPNDCVHWCLPGPIDTWNEILLDVMIKNMGKVN